MALEKTDKHKLSMKIINKLNDENMQGSNIFFDCGELGICNIFWDKTGWMVKWFVPVNVDKFLGK